MCSVAKKFLCPTCDHASHDWCNKKTGIFEAQTECKSYTNEEVRANKKQKELSDKFGIIGMCMNPYEPFDVTLIDTKDKIEMEYLKELRQIILETPFTTDPETLEPIKIIKLKYRVNISSERT